MDGELSIHMTGLQIHSESFRELLAEFLGTVVLGGLGFSVNANLFLKNISSPLLTPWVWGLALTSAIYVCGGVSGGHVNPTVTLGLASVGKLSWSKVPHYIIGQFVGAFAGSALTYLVYFEAISKFTRDNPEAQNLTSSIFVGVSTSPVNNYTKFIDQPIDNKKSIIVMQCIYMKLRS
uniref:Aquaporin n=1 Tax=Tetranychus urticae TaxID=32264 RepID=T1K4S2_TETUR